MQASHLAQIETGTKRACTTSKLFRLRELCAFWRVSFFFFSSHRPAPMLRKCPAMARHRADFYDPLCSAGGRRAAACCTERPAASPHAEPHAGKVDPLLHFFAHFCTFLHFFFSTAAALFRFYGFDDCFPLYFPRRCETVRFCCCSFFQTFSPAVIFIFYCVRMQSSARLRRALAVRPTYRKQTG